MQIVKPDFWRKAWSGLLCAVGLAIVSWHFGEKISWLGGAGFGILSGVILASLIRMPAMFKPGFAAAGKQILQLAVILLGAGLNLAEVWHTGIETLVLMLVTITTVFVTAWLAGKALGVRGNNRDLIASGTAICGGSAIAAVAASTRARREATGLAMATVFLLNALALVLFPWIGHRIGLSPEDFGTWAGLAVHDVSSVVGAAASFDPQALPVAIAVKLGRTLWILPVSLLAAWLTRKVPGHGESKTTVPFFLVGFLATAILTSALPGLQGLVPAARTVSHGGFNLALFLIGLRFESSAIRRGGVGLLLQGTVQWIVAATVSLAWILLA